MAEELDSKIAEDFAERILKTLKEKPANSVYGRTHPIQFVRESHKNEEKLELYKKFGDRVPAHISQAVELLVSRGNLKLLPSTSNWEKRYCFKSL